MTYLFQFIFVFLKRLILTYSDAKVNGGWSGWSAWSGCAAGICAGNQRIRTRTCTNPVPSKDGKYCDVGESSEQKDCMSEYQYTFLYRRLIKL